MKRYHTSIKIILRFKVPVQVSDEQAAEIRAGKLIDAWLCRRGLDLYEITGERDITVDEYEENE